VITAPQTGMRVGVRFDKVPRTVQSEIDRFVFAIMARKARARGGPGAERRLSPRVELGLQECLEAEVLPQRPVGALSGKGAANPRHRIHDISTTGCSFDCPADSGLTARQILRLRLQGGGLDVEVNARVIHLS